MTSVTKIRSLAAIYNARRHIFSKASHRCHPGRVLSSADRTCIFFPTHQRNLNNMRIRGIATSETKGKKEQDAKDLHDLYETGMGLLEGSPREGFRLLSRAASLELQA
eukprot:g42017.t1